MKRKGILSIVLTALTLAVALLVPAVSALAEFDFQRYIVKQNSSEDGRISAEEMVVRTPEYEPQHDEFTPRLGTYTYDVSWAGIPAASAEVTVKKDGQQFHVATRVRSSSGVDLLYKLRYNADGWFSAVDYQPLKSTFHSKENSRVKFAELNFLPNGDIHAIQGKKGKEPEVKRFNTGNPTFDPFSAAFIARSVGWEKGQGRIFDTYNGKSRYLIHLTCVDEITTNLNGTQKKVWVISPVVQKLNDKDESKLREARIYVTADRHREILKIESEVFVGTVHTVLSAFKPLQGRSSLALRVNE